MLSEEKLAAFKAQLVEERDRLAHQLVELEGDGEDAAPSFDENFADSGQVAAEQGENRLLADALREQLADVEHALAKFDQGTYGICEASGQPIPKERLEAIPWARERVEYKVGGFGHR